MSVSKTIKLQLPNFKNLQKNRNVFFPKAVSSKQNESQPAFWESPLPKGKSKSWLTTVIKEHLPPVSSFDRARMQINDWCLGSTVHHTSREGHANFPVLMQRLLFQGVKSVQKGFLPPKMKVLAARWKPVALLIARSWLSVWLLGRTSVNTLTKCSVCPF